LDQPNFRIEMTSKGGKTTKLTIGNKSATGGNLYVQREGADKADLVPADIYDQLDKPAKSFRDTKLVEVKTPEVNELQVTSSKGSVALKKSGNDWTIQGPTTMPADLTLTSDFVMAVTGLRASEFVAEGPL